MKTEVQVHHSHYSFDTYYTKGRWASFWHQIDEIVQVHPETILEIGSGGGLLQGVLAGLGVSSMSVDVDIKLKPTIVGHAQALPFQGRSFDLVCAFQVLEHVPYETAIEVLCELARVSRRYVIISLPDVRHAWSYRVHIPLLGTKNFLIKKPRLRPQLHVFDGQHYWELNKRGFGLEKFIADATEKLSLVRTYRVVEYPYHRFFIFRCHAET